MEYSIITHALPQYVEAGGKKLDLDTRTCRALQALAVIGEEDIPAEIRIWRVLELMLAGHSFIALKTPPRPEDAAEAYEAVSGFLRGWPEDRKPAGKRPEEIFSFSEDHALIVASFRQAYGISLRELKALHWWEFRALLRGIPEGTSLSAVMGIRSMEIDAKDPPKVKTAKRKAKAAVALRHTAGGRAKTGEEIVSDAFASL